MSNWKERLKKSQGSQSNFIKMNPVITFEVKRVPDKDESAFEYYNKVDQKRFQIQAPLKGVIIGKCMQASYWNEKTEIGYTSTDYFSHRQITFFQNGGKSKKPVFKGDFDGAGEFFKGTIRQRQKLFLATAKGLYAVVTNLSIAIDQLKQQKEFLLDYEMVLTPHLYSGEELWIKKETKDILKKSAVKNRPSCVRIEKGEEITENMAMLYNIGDLSDLMEEYRKSVDSGFVLNEDPIDPDAPAPVDAEFEARMDRVEASAAAQAPVITETGMDGLPF